MTPRLTELKEGGEENDMIMPLDAFSHGCATVLQGDVRTGEPQEAQESI